jgi:hypothetical protein
MRHDRVSKEVRCVKSRPVWPGTALCPGDFEYRFHPSPRSIISNIIASCISAFYLPSPSFSVYLARCLALHPRLHAQYARIEDASRASLFLRRLVRRLADSRSRSQTHHARVRETGQHVDRSAGLCRPLTSPSCSYSTVHCTTCPPYQASRPLLIPADLVDCLQSPSLPNGTPHQCPHCHSLPTPTMHSSWSGTFPRIFLETDSVTPLRLRSTLDQREY